jgi:hypothetical protein
MRIVAAKFMLSQANEQKQNHLEISQELFDHVNNDGNLLKSIITGVKTWVYSYNVETKVQSSKWVSKKSPRPKKYTKFGQM